MYHDKHSAGLRLGHLPRHNKGRRSRKLRTISVFMAAVCLMLSVTTYPASAATSMSSLQNKLDKLSQSIQQHKTELNNAKKKEAAAKALESELKEKVSVLQSQISVLKGQISEVQNSIGIKEQEITAKQAEITQKEQEIADQWDNFKSHMAAMQELRDGGSVAMLSSVNDLYELLTFNEVMQDISVKDTEILENMQTAKESLVNDRAQLVEERTQLQKKKAELDSQNQQMQSKQNELNSSVKEARLSAAEAQQAQKNAQAAIESDEMNYEAVKKEIQKLIAAAAARAELQRLYLPAQELYPHLQRIRLAQESRFRREQAPRGHRLRRPSRHPHLRSRQRLRAGGRMVQRRLRQLRYHLPRQNVRRQCLLHPVRPYALGGDLGGQVRQSGRPHRLRRLHRQLYRQPPPPRGLEGRLQGKRRKSPWLYSYEIILSRGVKGGHKAK